MRRVRSQILAGLATAAVIITGFLLTTLWSEFVELDKGPPPPPTDAAPGTFHGPDPLFPQASHDALTAMGGWILASAAFGVAWCARQKGQDLAAERMLLMAAASLGALVLLVDAATLLSVVAVLAAAAYCLLWDASAWTRAGMAFLVGMTTVFLTAGAQSGAAWTAFLLVAGLLAYPVAWALRTHEAPSGWVPLAIGASVSGIVVLVAIADVIRFRGAAEWGLLILGLALLSGFATVGVRSRPALQSD